jgi:hypothetical protein
MAIKLWPGVGYFGRKLDHGRAESALLQSIAWPLGVTIENLWSAPRLRADPAEVERCAGG